MSCGKLRLCFVWQSKAAKRRRKDCGWRGMDTRMQSSACQVKWTREPHTWLRWRRVWSSVKVCMQEGLGQVVGGVLDWLMISHQPPIKFHALTHTAVLPYLTLL